MRFRLQALVHQGEPDELDIVPDLVKPRAVAAAVVLGVAIAAAIVWAFIGNLPRQVTASGLLTPDAGVQVVQSPFAGVVQKVEVRPQQVIAVGTPVATVQDAAGNAKEVTSPFRGTALQISAAAGQPIRPGETLLSVQSADAAPTALHAVLFVPSSKVSQIGPGMSVQVSVSSAPSAAFGLLRGKVASVSPYPVTSGQALGLLGNDLLVRKLVGNDVVQVVTVTLQRADTKSGFAWTTKNGPPFPLIGQSLVHATVRVGNEHPVTFVFGK